MLNSSRRGVSPVIAIVLLLMMTVAAAGAAYFWLTSMQSSMQESSRKSIENIMEASSRRVTAQATLCKPTYPYKGLKGYWMMDGGSGDYANDSSGYDNDGTLYPGSDGSIDSTSGMWTDGQVGGALKFDGNDSYGNIPYGNWMNQDSFTITLWYRAGLQPDDHPRVISRAYWMDWKDYKAIGRKDSFKWMLGNGTHTFNLYSSVELHDWDLIAVTYSTSTNNIKMYVNGSLVTTETMNKIEYSTEDIWLGSYKGAGHYWNGTLDEVRIYSRALSQSAIEALYEAGKDGGRREVDITVRNIGSEEIPKATWVANLKHDGTNVETDAYNASSIGTGELKTLKFYFADFKPNTEYTIDLEGTGTSTTVSC